MKVPLIFYPLSRLVDSAIMHLYTSKTSHIWNHDIVRPKKMAYEGFYNFSDIFPQIS